MWLTFTAALLKVILILCLVMQLYIYLPFFAVTIFTVTGFTVKCLQAYYLWLHFQHTGFLQSWWLSPLSHICYMCCVHNDFYILLFLFQECFPHNIHVAYIIKPEKFWEKQKTSLGSAKYKFEVSNIMKTDWFIVLVLLLFTACLHALGCASLKESGKYATHQGLMHKVVISLKVPLKWSHTS